MFETENEAKEAYAHERDHFGETVQIEQCSRCKQFDAAPPFGVIQGSGFEGYDLLCTTCDTEMTEGF